MRENFSKNDGNQNKMFFLSGAYMIYIIHVC